MTSSFHGIWLTYALFLAFFAMFSEILGYDPTAVLVWNVVFLLAMILAELQEYTESSCTRGDSR